jgi:DNA-binding transcriptional LysR family regulator
VLRSVDDAKLRAEDLKRQQVSTVRIAATQLVCWAVLPELLSAFRMEEPNVRVLVTDAKRGEIESLLGDGQVDLGILAGVHGHHELHTEVLLTADTHLACNPAHPLARSQRISWAELADVPLISSGITAMLTRAELGKDFPIIVESELSFATSALGMVGANLGVAPMPGYVRSVLNPSQILMVPIVEPTIANHVVLCTIESRELSAAAAIFRAFLLAPRRGLP